DDRLIAVRRLQRNVGHEHVPGHRQQRCSDRFCPSTTPVTNLCEQIALQTRHVIYQRSPPISATAWATTPATANRLRQRRSAVGLFLGHPQHAPTGAVRGTSASLNA